MSKSLILFTTLCLLLLSDCSSPNIAGSGSNAGNPKTIAITFPTGEAAPFVDIFIRPHNYISLEKTEYRVPDFQTDEKGNVLITIPDSGDYSIECNYKKEYALQVDSDSLKAILSSSHPSMMLHQAASFEGAIDTTIMKSYDTVLVHIVGLEHAVPVKRCGHFSFKGVPIGEHYYTVTTNRKHLGKRKKIHLDSYNHTDIGTIGGIINREDTLLLREILDSLELYSIDLLSITQFYEDGSIRGVDLSGLGITTLPLALKKLNLFYLNLGKNPIETFPTPLLEMQSLHVLIIKECGLTTIPEEIEQLTNLRSLILSSNELKSLPKSLMNLPHLKRIAIGNNRLIIEDKELYQWLSEKPGGDSWEESQRP